jgi:integrase
MLQRLAKNAGVKPLVGPHGTKHTTITRMVEKGVPLPIISAIVGTSVPVLAKTYVHVMMTAKREAVRARGV